MIAENRASVSHDAVPRATLVYASLFFVAPTVKGDAVDVGIEDCVELARTIRTDVVSHYRTSVSRVRMRSACFRVRLDSFNVTESPETSMSPYALSLW